MDDNIKLAIEGYNAEKLAIQAHLQGLPTGDTSLYLLDRLREIDTCIRGLLTFFSNNSSDKAGEKEKREGSMKPMEPLEHLLVNGDMQIEPIFVAAKINAMIDRINDMQQIVYDFTGHYKP